MIKTISILIAVTCLVYTVVPNLDMKNKPYSTITHKNITELSGIIRADRPGEFWGHNDKGNLPALYRFTLQGKIAQTVLLDKAQNSDWEAITRDDKGNLYIGDIGDNNKNRKQYTVYRIPHPAPAAKKAASVAHIRYRYPGGDSHNCEAMFYFKNSLYFITKETKKNANPSLFRLSELAEHRISSAQSVGKIKLEGSVSDAAVSDNGTYMAILTDDYLYLSGIQSEKDMLKKPDIRHKIDFGNCEGLCFDEDQLVITNENGNIWFFSINELLNTSP